MKIVDHKAFLSMPAGTVFSKYEPCFFGPIAIKGDTTAGGIDFFVQEIDNAVACDSSTQQFEILETAERTGSSVALDFSCEGRDGLFEPEQLFAVWEKVDVEALIVRLQQCVAVSS